MTPTLRNGRRAAQISVLAAFLFSARLAGAAPIDVVPGAASTGSIRFTVQVPELERRALADLPGHSEARIRGYEVSTPPGEFALPSRIVMVAVPPAGEVRVRAFAVSPELHPDLRLPVVAPTVRGSKQEGESGLAPSDAQGRIRTNGAFPVGARGRVRVAGVSWLRDQRVAQIEVNPGDYDPATRQLTLYRNIEVEVEATGSPSAPALPSAAPGAADPFESLYRDALVNYQQGKAWRRRAPATHDPRAWIGGSALQGLGDPRMLGTVPDTSIYADRDWVKISIPSSGFYKVEFQQIRNRLPFGGSTTTSIDSLRLFTWPGYPVLPEETYCDSCDYREVAIGVVETNGNGLLDQNTEYIYFFSMGPSDWADLYDPSRPDTSFLNHPYSSRNFCYLTVATGSKPVGGTPRRIRTESGALGDTTAAVRPATFPARVHLESDTEYWPDATPLVGYSPLGGYIYSTLFWEKWYWASLNRAETFRVDVPAPGIDPGQPGRMRSRAWGLSFLVPCVNPGPRCSRSPEPEAYDHYLDLSFNQQPLRQRIWNGYEHQSYDSTFSGPGGTFTGLAELNTVEFSVLDFHDPQPEFEPLRVDRVGLAWVELYYQRRFIPVANELLFDSPGSGGNHLYRIGPFTVGPDSMPRVFDVTDPLDPVEVLGLEYLGSAPGEWIMRFQRIESGKRRYRVVPEWSRIVRAANADVFDAPSSSRENLRGRALKADYLLIYFDGFRVAADSLLRWRREQLPLMGSAPHDTFSVPISALYDQFSGGRPDPAAIRNFLRSAYFNWSERPTFVTMLGDASYDFKNISGRAPPGLPGTLLPSWEGGYDFVVARQFATDDWLLNVTDPQIILPDFFGGRIPATDAGNALTYVRDKLLLYERTTPLGEWRNQVMLIGDDNEQGAEPDPIGWDHIAQTTRLDRQGLPAHVDRHYVYLHTYPDGPNNTKPAARADVIDTVNEGVVMFNYIGHGSPFKVADESVFLDSDASNLVNRERPSVFVAASCDVGKFNDPVVHSLGERLILNPAGGCVGVISATELAFSFQNAQLNLTLYQQVTGRAGSSGQYETPLSQGLLAAKTGGTNNQKYQLMGDAAVQLVLPRLYASVTVEKLDGTPVTEMKRGETLRLRGQVLDRPGGTLMPFDGLASLLIEDAAPVDTVPGCLGQFCTNYPFRASPLYRGDISVTGGTFTGSFVVSMDARLGPAGRARAYVTGADRAWNSDGVGSQALVVSAGTAPTSDVDGPRLSLSFPGGSTSVRPDAVLKVDLFDDNGILITGRTPQNGIIVTLDGNSTQRTEITSTFRYAANSHQSGTAFFALPNLSPGPHHIDVSAADNLAVGINAAFHRTTASIDFEVTDNPALRVSRTFLFPNPASSGGSTSGGSFVVDAPGDSVNVLLRIYTVSGRLIRTLTHKGGLGQVQIPWNGLDDEGFRLGNGVYLFKVHVNPRDPDGSSNPRQKAEAEGRFVIVNR